jgi:hypothetical protein
MALSVTLRRWSSFGGSKAVGREKK